MSLRALLAAIVVVSVPIAVQGEPQSQPRRVSSEKKVCRVYPEPGSRIKSIRTCRTAAEEEDARQERRRVIDRIQTNKVSFGQ